MKRSFKKLLSSLTLPFFFFLTKCNIVNSKIAAFLEQILGKIPRSGDLLS